MQEIWKSINHPETEETASAIRAFLESGMDRKVLAENLKYEPSVIIQPPDDDLPTIVIFGIKNVSAVNKVQSDAENVRLPIIPGLFSGENSSLYIITVPRELKIEEGTNFVPIVVKHRNTSSDQETLYPSIPVFKSDNNLGINGNVLVIFSESLIGRSPKNVSKDILQPFFIVNPPSSLPAS